MGMTDLVVVDVLTHTGSRYSFPDVPRGTLESVIESGVWKAHEVFILVNVSGASLSLPGRIVKTVSWDGKVKSYGIAVHELSG